ncbi:recombinase [Brevibacillus parabrevis]|uniref:tyrosine-type recombinase/integrase n=1 Tax=Brevibacillus parabrevis TaxID=54914 RepID=UPI0007ABDB50|nr:tyrosine-type recombinase/integrase [Brevibacillus parabrevis]KZE49513.1 recombinase [Brevibacillus parabrevis]
MLLRTVTNHFLQYLSSIDRSEATISGYRKDLTAFQKFLESNLNGEVYIDEIVSKDIDDYLYYLKESRRHAQASRARNLHTLRSFFNYAYKKEYIPRNIALSVETISVQQKERIALSDDEVEQLVNAIDHAMIKVVVKVLYLTGMRISECLNVTMDDIDLNKQVIRVIAGKGNKDRVIPISTRLVPTLMNYIEHERPITGSNLLFCTKKTGKLSAVYVNKGISDAVSKLGWKKKVTAHILRHSFASQLVKKDVNLVQIQKLLGHSSLKVTSIYTHTDLNQLTEAVNHL